MYLKTLHIMQRDDSFIWYNLIVTLINGLQRRELRFSVGRQSPVRAHQAVAQGRAALAEDRYRRGNGAGGVLRHVGPTAFGAPPYTGVVRHPVVRGQGEAESGQAHGKGRAASGAEIHQVVDDDDGDDGTRMHLLGDDRGERSKVFHELIF